VAVYEYKAVLDDGQIVTEKIKSNDSITAAKDKLMATGIKVISIKKRSLDLSAISLGIKSKRAPKNKRASVGLNDAELSGDDEAKEAEANSRHKKKSFSELLKGDFKLSDLSLDYFKQFIKPSEEEVISFTEMFLLLKRSNFTNIRALSTLYQNASNPSMKSIIGDILNGMETGNYIHTTMEYYDVFPPTYINLIRVGEKTGSLVQSLEQALTYLQDNKEIKKRVKKALIGPLAQSAFMLVAAVLCIIFGLPVMEDMYAGYGLTDQIPKETKAVANFINWCGVHWYFVIAVIVGVTVVFNVWKRTPSGKYAWDKFILYFPVFGPLIMRLQLQKFFVAVNVNLNNNARLQDAIHECKSVVRNDVILSAVEAAEANLIVGDSWIEPFENMPKFPPMILEMLRIGMETDMATMIDNILQFMNEDIRITIDGVTKALPAISTSFLGIIMIGFVIIVLKPIMEVYMGSFLFDAYGM